MWGFEKEIKKLKTPFRKGVSFSLYLFKNVSDNKKLEQLHRLQE